MGTCCSAKYQSKDELVLSESHLHHTGSVGSFPDLDRFIRMRSLKVGPDVFVRINAGMIHEFYTFDELLGDGRLIPFMFFFLTLRRRIRESF